MTFYETIKNGYQKNITSGLRSRWNMGLMEYWNDRLTGRKTINLFFSLLIRTIPLFHHSMWIAQIDLDKKTYDFNIL